MRLDWQDNGFEGDGFDERLMSILKIQVNSKWLVFTFRDHS